MVRSFSGDPFLAARAARRAAAEPGHAASASVAPAAPAALHAPRGPLRLGEDLSVETLRDALAQGGLFGSVTLLLDFDEAFRGQAGVKPRNAVMKALADAPADAAVVVLDSSATPARQKSHAKLGRHVHLPTPRFERLEAWVKTELEDAGLRFQRDVPKALAELFGEDLPAIASEVMKLGVLADEELSERRVRQVANRPAASDAFKLIEHVAAGDPAAALATCRDLLLMGEAPQRVFGALVWQFQLVAKTRGALERDPRATPATLATQVGAAAFVAKRASAIASRLDESSLLRCLRELLESDVRAKSGSDPAWALESAVLRLAWAFRPQA